MPKGKPYDKEFKNKVISRIKQDGVSGADAAREFGIKPKLIYNWLAKATGDNPGLLEINKLKRQNQELLRMVGELTMEMRSLKKNIYAQD